MEVRETRGEGEGGGGRGGKGGRERGEGRTGEEEQEGGWRARDDGVAEKEEREEVRRKRKSRRGTEREEVKWDKGRRGGKEKRSWGLQGSHPAAWAGVVRNNHITCLANSGSRPGAASEVHDWEWYCQRQWDMPWHPVSKRSSNIILICLILQYDLDYSPGCYPCFCFSELLSQPLWEFWERPAVFCDQFFSCFNQPESASVAYD